ncbi:MAG: hypothetical protein ACXVH2_07985 [Methanobacterium sp.]
MSEKITEKDPGAHYRHNLRVKVTKEDLERGFIDVQLDPARVARTWNMVSPMLFTVLKKIARAGKSHNSYKEDLIDCQDALRRELEIMEEDGINDFYLAGKWGS